MTARPTLVVFALAAAGAALLLLAGPHALPSVYAPAALGAAIALAAVGSLLRDLRARDRWSIASGAGVLGFLVGGVSGIGPFPASLAYAGAFLPALVLFLAGVGRERQAFELAKLEEGLEDAASRPKIAARAREIRDEARAAAREMDPEARTAPVHAGDARAVYAYAAEVMAYGAALDGRYEDAIAALDEVPVRWMPAPMRPLMVGNLAFFHLCAGDADQALSALDRLPEKDAASEHRAVLRAARAMALVRCDRAGEALAIVGRSDEESLPPDRLKARFGLVRGAALIAAGEAESGEAVIAGVVKSEEGRGELSKLRKALPGLPG